MCHEPGSAPAVFTAPLVAVSSAGPLTLTSADGTAFAAHAARPAIILGPAVVVLPDNRGLAPFYTELCDHLAGQGHPAAAIDYYGRTAGPDLAERGPAFPFMEHLFQTKRDQLFADIQAAIGFLRTSGATDVCSLGFCFGGRLAFLTAGAAFGLAGVAGFYGFPGELFGAPGPTQLAASFTAPVLGLFGGADEGIPAEAVAEFDAALTAAGVPHELIAYPGMPHAFFDHAESGNPTACADAWSRVLASFKGAGGEAWRA